MTNPWTRRRKDKNRGKLRPSHAFTLVELLVVIATISILSALLLSGLDRAKRKAQKAVCTSNGRQWGVALSLYAFDNNGLLPPNPSATAHIGWMMPTMDNFWRNYLSHNDQDRPTRPRAANDVLFCPTEAWNRQSEEGYQHANDSGRVIGYFYLPGRDRNRTDTEANLEALTKMTGTKEWFYRTRLNDASLSDAPLLIDENQATGIVTSNPLDSRLTWYFSLNGKKVPSGTHRESRGVPQGGNFLFDDGHVSWFPIRQIKLGGALAGTGAELYFFKPPP
jgi:prepilin-type N-terminal cleavage/methylation domain-containing protein